MKKFQLRFWHPIAGIIILSIIEAIIDNLIFGESTWFLIHDLLSMTGFLCILLFIYVIIRNIIRAVKSRMNRQSPEASTYADEKEKELLRKQNEILVHLIQDEHREKDR